MFALLAAFALVGAACGGGGDGGDNGGDDVTAEGDFEGVTITFSTSLAEEEKAAIQQLLDEFQKDTGATVKLAAITSADLPQKLKVDVGAGKPTIHLFAQDNLALRVLVDEGLVEDLSDVELPDEILTELIPEEFDGKAYFLPYRPNVRVAYVNRERLDAAGVEVPTTTDEFREVAEKLKESGDGEPKVTLSLEFPSGAAGVTISEWVVSFGGDPVLLNDEGSVAAFEFLQDMWADGLFAKESLQAKYDTEIDNLTGEVAWLAQNWPFTTATLADQGILENFDVYEGWDGPDRAAHVIGGEVLGVPKGVTGKEKDAAIGLAQFLMSKDAQELLAAENAWPSVRDDAYSNVPEEQKATFDAINGALENGWYRPNLPYWADVQEAINTAVTQVIVKGEPAKATLDGLHDDIATAAEKAGEAYPPEA
ncbi:MAG: extracellular solute-binding protein [Actinobacteria bacterium]|nr:extracellular solute-binding protein [Actinomycetota bacterium]